MEKGWQQKVLDKGYVRYVDHMGSDEFIVECARMSTGGGFVSWEPYKKCSLCNCIQSIFKGAQAGTRHISTIRIELGSAN